MTLAEALPDATFTEEHSIVVTAAPAVAWRALLELRWSQLPLTVALLTLRGLLARPRAWRSLRVVDDGPVSILVKDAPTYVGGLAIARPWQAAPDRGPVFESMEAASAFREPGWLLMGWDFHLEPVSGGRTLLTASTRCRPTDPSSGRRFRRYWRLIRPFSGLVRRDILRAVRRHAGSGAPAG